MARVREKHDADNLGMLVVLDDPDSLEEVVLWFQREEALTLVSQNGDAIISDEVQALLPRYFAVFFDEVKDVAPELGQILLAPVPRTGEKQLH